MLTVEDFLEAGYKRFEQTYNSADYGLQKCIRDDKGKKYYITVFVYEHFKSEYYKANPHMNRYGFTPNVQYHEIDENDVTTDVSLIVDYSNTTVKIIEDKFEMLWKVLGGVYYERYYGEE